MGVGGGQQVGGQHRARDGAGAGHHHLGHCGMWYLLALLSSSMLHNSPLSQSPSMCLCVKLCRMFESAPTSSGFLEVRREPGLSLQMILLPSLALEWQQLVARPGPGLAHLTRMLPEPEMATLTPTTRCPSSQAQLPAAQLSSGLCSDILRRLGRLRWQTWLY